jgi:hypothetical protein
VIRREFRDGEVLGEATFSDDERYRYQLRRTWAPDDQSLGFVMLNPSTATERYVDPTIGRCVGFARSWGYGGIVVCNLFALRATDPKALRVDPDPVGPENDETLRHLAETSRTVVCAWGVHGTLYARAVAVRRLLTRASTVALGTTKAGHPRHPLYVPAVTAPAPYLL